MRNVNLILIFTAPSGHFRSMLRQRIFGVRLWLNILSVGVISVEWTGNARAAAVYPVKVSANHRYLVDRNNAPFLIMGDCPQSLTVNLPVAQTESFFSNRKAMGSTLCGSIWSATLYRRGRTAALSTAFCHSRVTFPAATIFAFRPLQTQCAFFRPLRPNDRTCRQIQSGCILGPHRDGRMLTNMVNNGPKACYDYGKYLGDQYRHFDNIVWMSGNDYDWWKDSRNDPVVTAMAKGIQATDPQHIHTIEASIGLSTNDTNWAAIVSLNAAYIYSPTYADVLRGTIAPIRCRFSWWRLVTTLKTLARSTWPLRARCAARNTGPI